MTTENRERPYVYAVEGCGGGMTLAPSIALMKQLLGESKAPAEITAHFRDGSAEEVPREVYAQPNPPTRDEALAFIHKRDARIAESFAKYGRTDSLWEVWGIMRCNRKDPEEKQVEDYIASAAWVWRELPDEDWHSSLPTALRPHPEGTA